MGASQSNEDRRDSIGAFEWPRNIEDLVRDERVKVIPASQLILQNEIGSGGQGKVRRALYKGKPVAAKSNSFIMYESGEEEFVKEICILSRLRHHNIVKFRGISIKGSRKRNDLEIWLITELCETDLTEILKRQLSTETKVHIAHGIARGMLYLHDRKIVHRDLKPDNILLSYQGRNPRIADLGFSRFYGTQEKSMTKNIGTMLYMAPEVWQEGKGYDEKADVYSYGALICELFGDDHPYAHVEFRAQWEFMIKYKEIEPRFPDPFHCPGGVVELIKQCMHADCESRPSFDTIVKFWNSVRKKQIDATYSSQHSPTKKKHSSRKRGMTVSYFRAPVRRITARRKSKGRSKRPKQPPQPSKLTMEARDFIRHRSATLATKD